MKNKTFYIGDTHFGSKNILLFENRPFESVDRMNEQLIVDWNLSVAEDDTIIVVGDFFDESMTKEAILSILNRLKGKIKLIIGNHDTNVDLYKDKLETVYDVPIVRNGFWIVSHEPQYVSLAAPYANIFAHVHNNPMYKTVSPRSFCVSAERIGYAPIEESELIKLVMECKEESL